MGNDSPLIVIELAEETDLAESTKGARFYRTYDTHQEVPRRALRVLSEPPTLVTISDNYPFGDKINFPREIIPEGANALLLGRGIGSREERRRYSASYCYVDLSQLEKQEIIPGIEVRTLASSVY